MESQPESGVESGQDSTSCKVLLLLLLLLSWPTGCILLSLIDPETASINKTRRFFGG